MPQQEFSDAELELIIREAPGLISEYVETGKGDLEISPASIRVFHGAAIARDLAAAKKVLFSPTAPSSMPDDLRLMCAFMKHSGSAEAVAKLQVADNVRAQKPNATSADIAKAMKNRDIAMALGNSA